eukprot:3716651-Amphidinium_carterae.1
MCNNSCWHCNGGEIVAFVGFAWSTGVWWTLWVPLAMGFGTKDYNTAPTPNGKFKNAYYH